MSKPTLEAFLARRAEVRGKATPGPWRIVSRNGGLRRLEGPSVGRKHGWSIASTGAVGNELADANAAHIAEHADPVRAAAVDRLIAAGDAMRVTFGDYYQSERAEENAKEAAMAAYDAALAALLALEAA